MTTSRKASFDAAHDPVSARDGRDVGLDPQGVSPGRGPARVGHGVLAHDEHGTGRDDAPPGLVDGDGHGVEVAGEVHDAASRELGRRPRGGAVEGEVHLEHARAVTEPTEPVEISRRELVRAHETVEQRARAGVGEHGAPGPHGGAVGGLDRR